MRLVVAALSAGLIWPTVADAVSRSPPIPAVQSGEAMTLYTTKGGDTLEGLAVRYLSKRSDAYVVQRLNSVGDTFRMRVGLVLRVPSRLLKSAPVSLTVGSVTGVVVRTGGGASATLARGDTLREGDRIATGANAFVTLVEADGTRVTLPSNTEMKIVALRRVLLEPSATSAFVIEHGRSDARVAPLHRPSDRFEIRTPASVAAVRGTEFRVGYDADRAVSTLEVLESRVGESAPDGADLQVFTAGQGVVRPLGGPRQIVSLPPAPVLQDPDAIRTTLEPIYRVADPHPGWRYHFTLARDKAFTDVIAEQYTTGVARFIGSPTAQVSLRVAAVDENGVEGYPSDYYVMPPLVGAWLSSPPDLALAAPTQTKHPSAG